MKLTMKMTKSAVLLIQLASILGTGNILAEEKVNLINPSILYVGDSHSYGKLGTTVYKNLSTISDHVVMESSCGSTPLTWLSKSGYAKTVCGFWKKDGVEDSRSVEHQTPKFSDELSKYAPEVVIVQLGTNIAAGEKPVNYSNSVEEMMNLIAEQKSLCIWIGPPDANSKIVTKEKLKTTNELLRTLSAKHHCHYIDSMAMTSFPKDSKEGIHYPPSLSAKWGEDVSVQILKILAE